MGRFGDSIIAHLTPGEITIPIQLQSPAVLKAIREEFKRVGVSPAQFVAGSHKGSRNPQTGAQEFSLLGGMLPTILGVVGGAAGPVVAPGVGTAIGAGLGSAAGEAASGGSLAQDRGVGLASGIGSAAAPGVGVEDWLHGWRRGGRRHGGWRSRRCGGRRQRPAGSGRRAVGAGMGGRQRAFGNRPMRQRRRSRALLWAAQQRLQQLPRLQAC